MHLQSHQVLSLTPQLIPCKHDSDPRVMTDSLSHGIQYSYRQSTSDPVPFLELKKGKSPFETSPVLNEFATEYTPIPILYAAINTVIILLCMLIY